MKELNELNKEVIALEGLLVKEGVDSDYLSQLKICYMEKYGCFNTKLIQITVQPLTDALNEYLEHIRDNYEYINGRKKR